MGVGEEGGSRREKGREEGERKIRRENKKGRGTCLIAVIYPKDQTLSCPS